MPVVSPSTIPASSTAQRFNAMPLAFCGFSIGSILLGFVNTGLVTNVNAVTVGSCIASAGFGLGVGSISELFKGELFSGNVMGVFAGFYVAYGILFIPSTGFTSLADQEDGVREMQICAALFSMVYAVPALLFFLATLKEPWLIRILMFQVTVAFFCSGIGNAVASSTVIAVGGWFSITLGVTAWYMMAAMMYTHENTYFVLPVF
ncbi:GPR1/FUN34/yaaH family-domain-containing protein [Absidia repens]|uniref:GPR1/FUN34/yaaH family-domain-containing protein n=1 Tax=Absidia repens TaxID=90262 RepID=A0A1X2IAJ6_9FUNG|nr:GPR1/FUN34/yaaH family-domain-containing protein [Absidia repens]